MIASDLKRSAEKIMETITQTTSPDLEITSHGNRVVANGSVYTFDPSNITFRLFGLTYHFQFAKDEKGQRVENTKTGEKAIQLVVFNFDSPLGTGLLAPIEVGKIEGKILYLILGIYALSEGKNKLIHYTFYQGK